MDAYEEIMKYIKNSIDDLVKVNSMGIEGYAEKLKCSTDDVILRIEDAESYLAFRTDMDCVNMNASDFISGMAKSQKTDTDTVTAAFDEYIALQDTALWRSLSMEKVPTAEEFIEYILTSRLDGVTAANRNRNTTYICFAAMLFNPVVKMWKTKWKDMCSCRVNLYDIHNRLCETTEYLSADKAIAFACFESAKYPERYSRYVILINTPFNTEHDVIYTVEGGFSAKHVCRNRNDAKAWRAVYYDYTDKEVSALSFSDYPDERFLVVQMMRIGAMYYVLTYRNSSCGDFTVQYFKSDRNFHNPDAVWAIDKLFFDRS